MDPNLALSQSLVLPLLQNSVPVLSDTAISTVLCPSLFLFPASFSFGSLCFAVPGHHTSLLCKGLTI